MAEEAAEHDGSAYCHSRYATRKAAGLCVVDGADPAASNSVYCQKHLDKQRARQKKRARDKAAAGTAALVEAEAQRAAAGVCVGCGGEPWRSSRCRRCEALRLEKEEGLTRHEARKSVKLCQRCDELATDTLCCDAHRARRHEHNAGKKADGICAGCNLVSDRPGQHYCSVCAAEETQKRVDRAAAGLCVDCGKVPPLSGSKACADCRKVNRTKDRRKNAKLRREVIAAYGGRCMCCGERSPELLEIDHTRNDGNKHRRQLFGNNRHGNGVRLYTWLRQHGFPQDGFQLLCSGCNRAKARYGICPHELARRAAAQDATAPVAAFVGLAAVCREVSTRIVARFSLGREVVMPVTLATTNRRLLLEAQATMTKVVALLDADSLPSSIPAPAASQ